MNSADFLVVRSDGTVPSGNNINSYGQILLTLEPCGHLVNSFVCGRTTAYQLNSIGGSIPLALASISNN